MYGFNVAYAWAWTVCFSGSHHTQHAVQTILLGSKYGPNAEKRKPYLRLRSVLVGVAGQRTREPPEPIPNSEVKPRSVHGVSVGLGHVKPRKLAAPLQTCIKPNSL